MILLLRMQISASELDFWVNNCDVEDMKLKHEGRMYPPKVSAVVYNNSHENFTAAAAFTIQGATGPLHFNIVKQFSGSGKYAACNSEGTVKASA